MIQFSMTFLLIRIYRSFYFSRINGFLYNINITTILIFINRIRRTISNSPLHTGSTRMLYNPTFIIQFPLYLLQNIFNDLLGLITEFHIIFPLIIPVKYLIQITGLPTETPPIADHFKNIIIWHIHDRFCFFRVVVMKNPILPMMRIIVNMYQPSIFVFFYYLMRTIPTVEICIIRNILFRICFTGIVCKSYLMYQF